MCLTYVISRDWCAIRLSLDAGRKANEPVEI
jgi:hypothetical protein